MPAADPHYAFGQQPPPFPIMTQYLLFCVITPSCSCRALLRAAPSSQTENYLLLLVVLLFGPKRTRYVQKCIGEVLYKIGDRNNNRFSSQPTA